MRSLRRRQPWRKSAPIRPTTTSNDMTSHRIPPFIAFLALVAFAAPAATQEYPSRPLRIVVGFTPGGGPDLTARHIALRLSERLKQQVIVENRPGAGGT